MYAVQLQGKTRIDEYEALAAKEQQVEIGLREEFPQGLYVRQVTVPAGKEGTAITGAKHLGDYVSFLMRGVVSVWGEGEELSKATLLVAPMIIYSKAGTRRIGVVHEDMIWADVFPNPDESRDGDAILSRYVSFPPVYYTLRATEVKCLH